jgi:hypothetical protein
MMDTPGYTPESRVVPWFFRHAARCGTTRGTFGYGAQWAAHPPQLRDAIHSC